MRITTDSYGIYLPHESYLHSVMKGHMHHFMSLLFSVVVKLDVMTLRLKGLNLFIGQGLKVGVVTYEQLILLCL